MAGANNPDAARFIVWYDVLGIDTTYDYDPIWAKCVKLGIAPTFHSSSQGLRLSLTNFVYNHIGHFAAGGRAVAKADFPRWRHPTLPDLNFAFLAISYRKATTGNEDGGISNRASSFRG